MKIALYLDLGCHGGGVIHWAAQLLRTSPDVSLDATRPGRPGGGAATRSWRAPSRA